MASNWRPGAKHPTGRSSACAPPMVASQNAVRKSTRLESTPRLPAGSDASTPSSSMRDAVTVIRAVSTRDADGPPEISVPRPTCTPFSSARRSGNTAFEKNTFDRGQCATPLPAAAIIAMSSSSIKVLWARIVLSVNRPKSRKAAVSLMSAGSGSQIPKPAQGRVRTGGDKARRDHWQNLTAVPRQG